jgi:hypothetical protein
MWPDPEPLEAWVPESLLMMLDTTRGVSVETFVQRLAETIDWCIPRAESADAKVGLRTPELSPWPLAGGRREVVESVAQARHIGLRWPTPRDITSLAGGRLLGYTPDDNLADGAAESATAGFFDGENVPPWDTWVGYVYESERCNYLVAWVPPGLRAAASLGIEVNPEECIWWLDERNTELVELLRGRGLL